MYLFRFNPSGKFSNKSISILKDMGFVVALKGWPAPSLVPPLFFLPSGFVVIVRFFMIILPVMPIVQRL